MWGMKRSDFPVLSFELLLLRAVGCAGRAEKSHRGVLSTLKIASFWELDLWWWPPQFWWMSLSFVADVRAFSMLLGCPRLPPSLCRLLWSVLSAGRSTDSLSQTPSGRLGAWPLASELCRGESRAQPGLLRSRGSHTHGSFRSLSMFLAVLGYGVLLSFSSH